MSKEIPFFELFAQLQLSPELRLKLLGAVIASACIHQDTLSMELNFRCLLSGKIFRTVNKVTEDGSIRLNLIRSLRDQSFLVRIN